MDLDAKRKRAAELHQQIIDLGASPRARQIWRECKRLLDELEAAKKQSELQSDELPF